MSYEESQLLISQINRSAQRNPAKCLMLINQFLRQFGYQDFIGDLYVANYQLDLKTSAQIALKVPTDVLRRLPDTNETCQWKAQLLQEFSFARHTDYPVQFDAVSDRFKYFLLNMARKDFVRASELLHGMQQSDMEEVADLLYRSVVCKRENAFKLIKSQYAAQLQGYADLVEELQSAHFKPEQEGVVVDELD